MEMVCAMGGGRIAEEALVGECRVERARELVASSLHQRWDRRVKIADERDHVDHRLRRKTGDRGGTKVVDVRTVEQPREALALCLEDNRPRGVVLDDLDGSVTRTCSREIIGCGSAALRLCGVRRTACGVVSQTVMDWRTWHADYEDTDSALARRLVVVQEQIRAALDRAAPGPLRAISICAGQGHDLIGVLVGHPRRADITARLVEIDEHNVLIARRSVHAAGLDTVEVVAGDASVTDAYAGAVPADLILLCGVLGNISAADIASTVRRLPLLCAPAATVIWTCHRHPPDFTPFIRETFEKDGFAELSFEDSPPFGVGVNRLLASPQPFQDGIRLFEFVGYDVFQPDFHASQGGRDQSDSGMQQ